MCRHASIVFESLEQRSLLSATLVGPDATNTSSSFGFTRVSPNGAYLAMPSNGNLVLESLASKSTATIPNAGGLYTFTGDSKNVVYIVNNTQAPADPKIFVYNVASGAMTQIPFASTNTRAGTQIATEISASPDGHYVAFGFNPQQNFSDNFHVIELVDLQAQSVQQIAGNDAVHPSFSPDSRNVAFGAGNNVGGVDEYNIPTGNTTLISVDNNGNPLPALSDPNAGQGTDQAAGPIVFSADGKYVAFPLAELDPFRSDVVYNRTFIRNLAAGTTQEVTSGNYTVSSPISESFDSPVEFSPDDKYLLTANSKIVNVATGATADIDQGTVVHFGMTSEQLLAQVSVANGSSNSQEIYGVNLISDVGALLTTSTSGGLANGNSKIIGLTPDRTHAYISSTSTNLAANSPTDGSANVYLLSLTPDNGAPLLLAPTYGAVSLTPYGGILSPDDHHVAFISGGVVQLSDVSTGSVITVPGDNVGLQGFPISVNFTSDGKFLIYATQFQSDYRVFRYNIATNQTVSVPFNPSISNSGLSAFSTSPDGTYAAFQTSSSVAVTNLITDAPVFATFGDTANLAFSPDSKAFYLNATINNTAGVYAVNLTNGTTTLLSTNSGGQPLPDFSGSNTIIPSLDGKYLAFTLGGAQSNGASPQHTYVRNLQTGAVTQYDDPNAGGSGATPVTGPIAFSSGDQYLLEGSNSAGGTAANRFSIVNLSSGQRTIIPGQSGGIGIGFGPGGNSVIFDDFSGQGGIRVFSYDIASGVTSALTISGFANQIAPDGTVVLVQDTASPSTKATPVPGDGQLYALPVPPGSSTTPISPTAPTVVTDDDDAGVKYVGNWYSSQAGSGYNAGDFRNDGNQLKGSSSVTFPLKISSSGTYAVFAKWPSITFGSVATNVPFDVITANGTVTVTENETQNTGQWVLLGTFSLNPSTAAIVVRNAGTTGIVLADAVGTAPSSSTVITPPPPAPTPIIVDDDDSGVVYTGNWYSSQAGNSFFAGDFRNDGNQLKGSSSVTFPAKIASAGSYQVYIRYPSITFGTASSNVPVDIVTSTGTQTITVDETKNTGQFLLLGTFTLDPATAKVRIRNGGTTGLVLADAVEYMASSNTGTGGGGVTTTTTPPSFITDDDSPRVTYTGNWYSSQAGTGYLAGDFRNDGNQLKGSLSAKFTFPLGGAGSYQVYVRFPSITFGTAATNVPIDIVTTSGVQTVLVDETQNTGLWVLLGTFNLDPSSASVTIRNTGTNGIVLADAVGLAPVH